MIYSVLGRNFFNKLLLEMDAKIAENAKNFTQQIQGY